MARYVPGHSNPRLCPETLATHGAGFFSKVENPIAKPAVQYDTFFNHTTNPRVL